MIQMLQLEDISKEKKNGSMWGFRDEKFKWLMVITKQSL